MGDSYFIGMIHFNLNEFLARFQTSVAYGTIFGLLKTLFTILQES